MPDFAVGAQIFDFVFHPTSPLVYAGLLTGEVKAFGYGENDNLESLLNVRPSKRSCRALAITEDGGKLWVAGKAKALHTLDTQTGRVIDVRPNAHDVAINRVQRLTAHLLSTGDDDGVIKLWDPRKRDSIRAYTHHFDFISDFLYLEDQKQLVSTSGDGSLSVIDIRSKKTQPLAQSEDQEDELLCIVPFKGGQKFAVGTQLGILSIFNKRNGWGDCVDRIPGHPHSIDALCALPAHYPDADSTILTGSSDGLLRAVQLLPTKMLGIVADHGEFPIERIAVDLAEQGRWVGSAGHEEVLKLTDLREVFEDDDEDEEKVESRDDDESGSDQGGDGDASEEADLEAHENPADPVSADVREDEEGKVENQDSSDDEDALEKKKRKRKKDKDPMKAIKRKKGRNEVEAEPSFFADL
ncbi:WD40 repeat-like protein [Amylocystis lapponica]|nr:WD40 repeat-like protein [Amylocystis lapponica]